MITGTIIFEDTLLTYIDNNDGTTSYIVADNLEGKQESKTVDSVNFQSAIAVLFVGEEKCTQEMYEQAESIQPENPVLRFIP